MTACVAKLNAHRAAILRHIQYCPALSCMTEFYEYILVASDDRLSFPRGIVATSLLLASHKHMCPLCVLEFHRGYPKPISRVLDAIAASSSNYSQNLSSVRAVGVMWSELAEQIAMKVAKSKLIKSNPSTLLSPSSPVSTRPRLRNKKLTPSKDRECTRESRAKESIGALQQQIDALMIQCQCVVCMVMERSQITEPCSHMALCEVCAPKMTTCPICSAVVTVHKRFYWA